MPRPRGKHLTDAEREQIRETVRQHVARGGTAASAARELGIRTCTVQQLARTDPAIAAGMNAVGTEIVPSGMWIKTKPDEDGIARSIYLRPQPVPDDVVDRIKTAFEEWSPPERVVPAPESTNADLLTIYPIADTHLGLRAVADESGADFDLAIAANRFRETTARLFDRSPNSSTALILQLGDFFHVDDDLALTPNSKNSLQVSDRLLDIVRVGVDIMVDYIYHALRKHDRVIVKCLKGNHDLNAWLSLYIGLDRHFRADERVTIDGGASDYWFFRWRFVELVTSTPQGPECVTWPFAKSSDGYGRVNWQGKPSNAHAIICELVHGPKPTPKHEACHGCGKGHEGCVNPNHLRWGTRAENIEDAFRHGARKRSAKHFRSA